MTATTPPLDDWVEEFKANPNVFWHTPMGDLLNLIEELVHDRELSVEIVRKHGESTTCTVRRDGVVIFDGHDYSKGLVT